MDTTPAHLIETTEQHDLRFHGRLLDLYVDTVHLADGTKTTREVVTHPGAVCILPILPNGDVILVRQWRQPLGRVLWEVPAGTRDPGEDPALTAVRELEEETGYTAATWKALGPAPVAPGYSNEIIWFYTAQDLTPGQQRLDHDERLDVGTFDRTAINNLFDSGSIDCKTLAILGLYDMAHGETHDR